MRSRSSRLRQGQWDQALRGQRGQCAELTDSRWIAVQAAPRYSLLSRSLRYCRTQRHQEALHNSGTGRFVRPVP
ncbi:hypothetical protein SBBP2_1860007 [Burkholderiales bacterium]|nr:hypothetical protein SBBP2_1860007 [Burkholderiales bacterium]